MWFACGVNSLTGRSDYGAAAGLWRAGQPAPPLPESRRQPFVQNGRPNAMAGPKRVLLVETDPGFRRRLEEVAGPIADLHAVGDFQAARRNPDQGFGHRAGSEGHGKKFASARAHAPNQ